MENPETEAEAAESEAPKCSERALLDPLEAVWLVARDDEAAAEIETLMKAVPDPKLKAVWGHAPQPSAQTSDGLPPDIAKLLRGES